MKKAAQCFPRFCKVAWVWSILAVYLCLSPATPVFAGEAAGASVQPTAEEARAFVEQAEARLLELGVKADRAAWVQSNFITFDTETMAAEARKDYVATSMELAARATRFDGLKLPEELRRKLTLLKLAVIPLPAPSDPAKQSELTEAVAGMESMYGRGKYCPKGEGSQCLDINDLSRILATSRNPDELLEAWRGWRTISPPMRERYQRFVELSNEGARALGYPDLGALWLSAYDMPPEKIAAEVERLWQQLRPLYLALHAHVRARLVEQYGPKAVPPEGPIPAHQIGRAHV